MPRLIQVVLFVSLGASFLSGCAMKEIRNDISNLWVELGNQTARNDGQDIRLSRVERNVIELTLAEDTLFRTDSATLTPRAYRELKKASRILGNYPDIRIVVEGHTDSTGPARYNMKLSEQRADRVADVLIESGLKEVQIRVVGFGQTRPVTSNSTFQGRALNRRVTIQIGDGKEEPVTG